MRDVAESRSKGDLGNAIVSRISIEKLARAHCNPLLVEVLSHRATCFRKQTVHIAFGSAESGSQCCSTELWIVAVTIDMVKHHRQQHRSMHALHGHIRQNFRRARNELGYVRADQCRGSWELRTAHAEFGVAAERPGESAAGLGRGQVESRTIQQRYRQQSSRHSKAEQFEVVAVADLERLCRIGKRQVTGRTDLLVASLRGASQPFELEVDKAKIVRARGNVRSKAKHRMPGGCDQRYLNRSGINPRNCAFEGQVSNLAWLKSNESSRKVVGPASKGLIRTARLGRPFHEHPKTK
jgi:hypothetical protein